MLELSQSDWISVFNGDIHILNGRTIAKEELAKYINSFSNAMFTVLRSLQIPEEVLRSLITVNQKEITQYLWYIQSSDLSAQEKERIANVILWAVNSINIAACCGMVFEEDAISTGKLPTVGKEKPKELN